MRTLTDQDRAILDIEAYTWKHVGLKEQAILDETGLSPTRYYQRLNALVDTEAALAHAPLLVNRLKRVRYRRQRARSTRRVA